MNDKQYNKLLETINNKLASLYDPDNFGLAKRLSHINSVLREVEWILLAIAVMLLLILIF